jgi:hypothetical protein
LLARVHICKCVELQVPIRGADKDNFSASARKIHGLLEQRFVASGIYGDRRPVPVGNIANFGLEIKLFVGVVQSVGCSELEREIQTALDEVDADNRLASNCFGGL